MEKPNCQTKPHKLTSPCNSTKIIPLELRKRQGEREILLRNAGLGELALVGMCLWLAPSHPEPAPAERLPISINLRDTGLPGTLVLIQRDIHRMTVTS